MDEGLCFELLFPEASAPDAPRSARKVLMQLPSDATLGCLRAAAMQCGGGRCNELFLNRSIKSLRMCIYFRMFVLLEMILGWLRGVQSSIAVEA